MDKLRNIAIELSLMPLNVQKSFIKELFSNISDSRKKMLFETAAYLTCPSSRWVEIGKWMEKHFIKDMKRTPYQVAMMCLNYTKMDTKMKPLFIKLARQAKDRVRKRIFNNDNKKEKKKN
ncbi:MAG: hypothetical protein HXY52_00680 [Nitrospirae bacterium]|jgi:hypothetical protein|nr:hypothetical protein [Nitrospirota bacterium]